MPLLKLNLYIQTITQSTVKLYRHKKSRRLSKISNTFPHPAIVNLIPQTKPLQNASQNREYRSKRNPTDQSPSIKLEKKSAFPTADWPSDIFQIGPIYMRAAFSRSRLAPEWGWWIVPALANTWGCKGSGHLLKIHPIHGSNCLL